MFSTTNNPHFIHRKKLTTFAVGCVAAIFLTTMSAGAQADSAVKFMNQVKADLLRAARRGTPGAFKTPIRKHADVRTISLFSLGSYAKSLPSSRRANYYAGVTQFMARYFSSQSSSYKIVKATVLNPSKREGSDYFVDSKVFLNNGQSYDVRWRLKRRSAGFKIVDVQVLGFWLSPFQRNLFRSYIQKHDGNVNALLVALNY